MDLEYNFNFKKYLNSVEKCDPIAYVGYVTAVNGLEILSNGPYSKILAPLTALKSDVKLSVPESL